MLSCGGRHPATARPYLRASACICGCIILRGRRSQYCAHSRALPGGLRLAAADACAPLVRRGPGCRVLIALCIWFDITPSRLSRGLSGLFVILRQMIPPSPGQQWQDILQGLAESVAMAFLGTFVAAVI